MTGYTDLRYMNNMSIIETINVEPEPLHLRRDDGDAGILK